MKYVISKYVEAANITEALKKAKKTPIHDVYIHSDSWKESGYSMDVVKRKMGFHDKDGDNK